jgi:hypothetical protein
MRLLGRGVESARMNFHDFYRQLFAPLESRLGRLDPNTLFPIMGFDGGGPLSFNTIGVGQGKRFVTYVSCELAVRLEQLPSDFGRYELLVSCSDEQWARRWVTEIGRMSFDKVFGHGHTLDFNGCVDASEPIQGVILEKLYDTRIGENTFGILRCIGITRTELEFARQKGSAEMFARLKKAGLYPHTDPMRCSVI